MAETPPQSGSDWAAYQRLVLAELERHNANMREIDVRLQVMSVDIALIKAQAVEAAEVAKRVRELDSSTDRRLAALEVEGGVSGLDKRLRAIENNTLTEDAVAKYRNWIIGMGVTMLASVLVPLVRIYFTGQ